MTRSQRLVPWVLRLVLLGVGAWWAIGSGGGLVQDAYWASRGGQAWFFDTATRVAIPSIEIGLVAGLALDTARRTRQVLPVLRVVTATLWLCVLANLVMAIMDDPGRLIGIAQSPFLRLLVVQA